MMNRASKILLVFAVAAAGASAQNTAPAPSQPAGQSPATPPTAGTGTSDASSVVLAPKPKDYIAPPPADSDGMTRSVSPGIAAELSAGFDRYSPPTPTPTPTAVPEGDKPKNEIKRLPSYIVRESRPPIFRERDLNTTQGQVNLSFASHPGLIFGNILGLNSSVAYDMYKDDERLENINEMTDLAHAMSLGGASAEGTYILQQTQNTYMRTDDTWNLSAPGPGAGTLGGWGK
jgi:hypothetical protein